MSQLKDLSVEKRESELEKLFSNSPLETEVMVELPSKGKFYKNFVGVKVIPLLFEDEQKILLTKNKNLNIVNEIISKCCIGVNINDLLLQDKVFLILKIREISYGSDYGFSLICPGCSNDIKSNIDLQSSLPIQYVDDSLEDPRTIMLPDLNVECKIRMPRVSDEISLRDIENMHKNMYRFIVSLNNIEDPVFISKALSRMKTRDKKKIYQEINNPIFGIQTSFMFECPVCKYSSKMELPFDSNFFSVA